ncbi:MAG TPA: hypothetical protein VGN42_21375 [Pirellulales bacterium]|nr:hypothetical protein [Pirellulales bacterium]
MVTIDAMGCQKEPEFFAKLLRGPIAGIGHPASHPVYLALQAIGGLQLLLICLCGD